MKIHGETKEPRHGSSSSPKSYSKWQTLNVITLKLYIFDHIIRLITVTSIDHRKLLIVLTLITLSIFYSTTSAHKNDIYKLLQFGKSNLWPEFKSVHLFVMSIAFPNLSDVHSPWDGVEMVMLVGGLPPCLSWRMTDLIRDTSFVFLADFGLKSQSLAIRSHSVPGAWDWGTPLFVAANSRSVDSEAARCAACNLAICKRIFVMRTATSYNKLAIK